MSRSGSVMLLLLLSGHLSAAPRHAPPAALPLEQANLPKEVRSTIEAAILNSSIEDADFHGPTQETLATVTVSILDRSAKGRGLLLADFNDLHYCNDRNCPFILFRLTRDRAILLLEGGGELSVLKRRHHGLPDLQNIVWGGGYYTYRMEFNGTTYRKVQCSHLNTAANPPTESPCEPNEI